MGVTVVALVGAEALVELVISPGSRLNRYVWFPVDVGVMLATLAAIAEALWWTLVPLAPRWRKPACGGLVVLSLSIAAMVWPGPRGDWYQTYCADRTYLFVGYFVLASLVLLAGSAKLFHWPAIGRIGWAQPVRLHAAILWAWMLGRALLINPQDWHLQWTHFHQLAEFLEVAAAIGMILNCDLLRRWRRNVASPPTCQTGGLRGQDARQGGRPASQSAPYVLPAR